MDTLHLLGMLCRLVVIFVGFFALWRMWVARDMRRDLWTRKMRDIWTCQLLFILAVIEGNVELFYRGVNPTLALAVVFVALGFSIRGSYGSKYIITQK